MGHPTLAVQRRRFRVAVPATAVACLVFAVMFLPVWPPEVSRAASNGGLLLVGVVGMGGCLVRARLTSGRRRRSWLLIVAAGSVAVVGNLWTAVRGIDPVTDPSNLSDVTVAVALLLAITALLSFPTAQRRGIDLVLMALDGVVMGAAVLIITTILVYDQLLENADGSGVAAMIFPGLDVVLATVALLLVLRSWGEDRVPLVLVSAGFIMYAIADLSYAVLVVEGTFEFGSMTDLCWIAGYLLIGLAAWYPTNGEEPPPPGEATSRTKDTATVFVVLLLAAAIQIGFATGGRFGLTQALLWLVLILAAGTRQTLLTYDNAALRRGLERRVREQTADLRRMARQTEVLITSVGDGVYGVDAAGHVTFVNPSGAAALGYPPDELLGRHAHELFHAPAADGTPFPYEGCYIAEAITLGMVANAEEDLYVRSDGEVFPVEITASPLRDDDRVRGAVVVFRDMTQRREVDRLKNEFLSVVSHELRTPLTSIRGSLGLLAGGRLGELTTQGRSLVRIALESSERLTRLINDLLDLERIEGGNRPLELRPIDAQELVGASVTEMEGFAREVGVTLQIGEAGGRVVADRDRLVQTLTNLLNNAIKFSETGSIVAVDALEQDDHVLFRVVDEGRGIPEDKLEAVFERFQQVDSSDARQKGGTGLGLAISREIVQRHGGRIWAESRLGEGTTLFFTLPLAGPDDPTRTSTSTNTSTAPEEETP